MEIVAIYDFTGYTKILMLLQEASNRRKLKTVRSVILQQLVMNNWEDAVDTFGIKVSCEALMPFTR